MATLNKLFAKSHKEHTSCSRYDAIEYLDDPAATLLHCLSFTDLLDCEINLLVTVQ